ncbi:hypothetical protein G6N74_06335 [Mesorhizobium sp. CGMCC 1.15528]|uniref:TonB C-terminal domain-containing protein n=1 Tax=Mesorhizobium zhangyense TaxID=1776730 RepID=A0A7C9R5Y2_9HYPH|nr:hypothetical protein [Mesorhizobium zhangyense]NGN40676.1 hypothetical protein [Mesorhizobium zhangyense]
MRFFLVFAFLLTSSVPSFAEESIGAFSKRLSRHVDMIRHNPSVQQAAQRFDPRRLSVAFRLAPDGSIKDVRVVRTTVSKPLSAAIGRAFYDLPPISNPHHLAASRPFGVEIMLGGARY